MSISLCRRGKRQYITSKVSVQIPPPQRWGEAQPPQRTLWHVVCQPRAHTDVHVSKQFTLGAVWTQKALGLFQIQAGASCRDAHRHCAQERKQSNARHCLHAHYVNLNLVRAASAKTCVVCRITPPVRDRGAGASFHADDEAILPASCLEQEAVSNRQRPPRRGGSCGLAMHGGAFCAARLSRSRGTNLVSPT